MVFVGLVSHFIIRWKIVSFILKSTSLLNEPQDLWYQAQIEQDESLTLSMSRSTSNTLYFSGFLFNYGSQDQIWSALYSEGDSYLTTALCWRGLCTAGVSWLLSEPIKPLSVSGDLTPSYSVKKYT